LGAPRRAARWVEVKVKVVKVAGEVKVKVMLGAR
jgi:hypothetical protein